MAAVFIPVFSTAIVSESFSISPSSDAILPSSSSVSACRLRTAMSEPPYLRFRRPKSSSRFLDNLQPPRVERKMLSIITKGKGGLFNPVVKLCPSPARSASDLHRSSGSPLPPTHVAEFRQHGPILPIECFMGRLGQIHQFLNIDEHFFLFGKLFILPLPYGRLRNLSALKAQEILPFLLFRRSSSSTTSLSFKTR